LKFKDVHLFEKIKPRIDHPEDLIWRMGSSGFTTSIEILNYAQKNTNSISLKWDGTPSLIWGYDPYTEQFTLTDKAGFNSTKYDGFPKSSKDLYNMLYSRAPTDEGRQQFASTIASLWPLFKNATPRNQYGFYQGDLLYVNNQKITDNYVEFKPNKILYRIPLNTELGRYIAQSKAGIAVHSFIKDKNTEMPVPVKDISDLKNYSPLAVIPTSMKTVPSTNVKAPIVRDIELIDQFINKTNLLASKISNLPELIGRYIGYMARTGNTDYQSAPKDFINWLSTTNTTLQKQDRMKAYINSNKKAYLKMWEAIYAIVDYKNRIKDILDYYGNKTVKAYMNDDTNQEGYVLSTPYGKIKIVNRSIYMRKD
jgi:hypothetical protein